MGEPDKLIGVFDTEAEAEAVADAYWWEQDLALTITEVPA
jgi:hypothetical protein